MVWVTCNFHIRPCPKSRSQRSSTFYNDFDRQAMSYLAFQTTSPYTLGTTVRLHVVGMAGALTCPIVVKTLGTNAGYLGRRCRKRGAVCTCPVSLSSHPGPTGAFLFAVIVGNARCQKWPSSQGAACELYLSRAAFGTSFDAMTSLGVITRIRPPLRTSLSDRAF